MGRLRLNAGSGCGCCVVVGLALTIAGAVFLGKYDPAARANQITAYNNAVNQWDGDFFGSGGEAVAFRNLGVLRVTINNVVSLNATSANIEQAAPESGVGISQYTQYAAFTTTAQPFVSSVVPWGGDVTSYDVTVSNQAGTQSFTRTVAFTRENDFSTSGKTHSCTHGTKSGNRCYAYFAPASSGMCLVVNPDTFEYAGACAITNSDDADVLAYSTDSSVLSNRLFDIAYQQVLRSGTFYWGNFRITVRSSKDPWVIAAQATQGYMTFGALDDALLLRGKILLGLGLALIIPVLLVVLGIVLFALKDTCSCKMRPFAERTSFGQNFSRRYNNSVKFAGASTTGVVRRLTRRNVDTSGGGATAPPTDMSVNSPQAATTQMPIFAAPTGEVELTAKSPYSQPYPQADAHPGAHSPYASPHPQPMRFASAGDPTGPMPTGQAGYAYPSVGGVYPSPGPSAGEGAVGSDPTPYPQPQPYPTSASGMGTGYPHAYAAPAPAPGQGQGEGYGGPRSMAL